MKRLNTPPDVGRVIDVDYDEEADVLYVELKPGRIVDNEPLDEDRVISLTVMDASQFTKEEGRFLFFLAFPQAGFTGMM